MNVRRNENGLNGSASPKTVAVILNFLCFYTGESGLVYLHMSPYLGNQERNLGFSRIKQGEKAYPEITLSSRCYQACQLSRVYRESHGFTTLLKGSRSNLTVFEAKSRPFFFFFFFYKMSGLSIASTSFFLLLHTAILQ